MERRFIFALESYTDLSPKINMIWEITMVQILPLGYLQVEIIAPIFSNLVSWTLTIMRSVVLHHVIPHFYVAPPSESQIPDPAVTSSDPDNDRLSVIRRTSGIRFYLSYALARTYL